MRTLGVFLAFFYVFLFNPLVRNVSLAVPECTAVFSPTAVTTTSKAIVTIPYLIEQDRYSVYLGNGTFSPSTVYFENITAQVSAQAGRFEINLEDIGRRRTINPGEYRLYVLHYFNLDPSNPETCLDTKINLLPPGSLTTVCPIYRGTDPAIPSTNRDIKLVFNDPPRQTFAIVLNTTPARTLYLTPSSNSVSIGQFTTTGPGTFAIHPYDSISSSLETSCGTGSFTIYDPSAVPPTNTPPPSTPTPPAPPCSKFVEIKPDNTTGSVLTRDQVVARISDSKFKFKCAEVETALVTIKTDPVEFVKSLMGILLSLAGGVALLFIIGSGYKIMTSQGNQEKLQEARDTITSAIVGLLFIILSMVILEVIGVDILHIPGFG